MIHGTVDVSEMMGSEMHLHVNAGGVGVALCGDAVACVASGRVAGAAALCGDCGRGSRPCRHGGRHIQACGSAGVAVAVIPGTAAAHAHTLARGPCPYGARGGPIRYGLGTRRHDDGAMRDGFAGGAETVVFRADDCGYGRDMLFAHISCLSFPCRYRAGCSRGSRVGRGGTVCGAGRTAASLPCVAGGGRTAAEGVKPRKNLLFFDNMVMRSCDFLRKKLFFCRLLTKFEKFDL